MNAKSLESKILVAALTVMASLSGPMVAAAEQTPRQAWVAKKGVPGSYKGKTNPLKMGADVIAKGKALYAKRCLKCHGVGGKGDGEEGAYYDPPPTDLTALAGWSGYTDAYIYWSIADGTVGIGKTGMPALKSKLKVGDIWTIVAYVRKAFAGK